IALSSARAADQDTALGKLTPWVVENTADGKEAEFLVVLPTQADLSGADALPTKEEKGRYVRDALWNTAQQTQAPLLKYLEEQNIEHRPYYIVNLIWVKGNRDIALALASRADVMRIEGNPRIRNVADPLPVQQVTESLPDSPATVESGVNYTRAPLVWATGYTGQGVVIAGADTGYRWTHTALKGHYRGWDGTTANHDYSWHDSVHSGGGTCGPNSAAPCDDNGHGTHTMGTMVGDDGGANQTGMAPGAKWIGCRNMDQGNGTPATYIECMEFFLAPYPVNGTPSQGDPTKAPHVTSNSWGCPASEGCSPGSLQQASDAQRAAGIMMVVAAGNSGSSCSTVSDPPSFYESVYTVGALSTGTDSIASFSSRGPVTADGSLRRKPDISAPGTSTRSSYRTSDTSYASLSGTSMATPHVAGAVALLLSTHPELKRNVTDIRTALSQAAVHLNSNGCDPGAPSTWPNNVFGYGRLDIKAAVDSVMVVTAAASRQNHNGTAFDLPLPLSGTPAVESRGAGGNYTIVLTFDRNVTTGSAAVASGSAAVSGSPTFSGNTMTVRLTNVSDGQTIAVSLTNVGDGASSFLPATTVRMSVLTGDANGDGLVNAADALLTRSRSGQPTDATNFSSDVNLDGTVNSADTLLIRSRAGASLGGADAK
ncbi:MAG: S8 family serine peptidase, partial [Verrucomicrobiota bacterium]|nr:S8 family serine peptidase [Verrucomicrobiota bacterium]